MGHSRKRLDLTGQRYGRLTVLEQAENVDGRTAWRCRCDCGQEVVAKSCHLRNGHVTSCGCAKLDCMTYVDGTFVEMLRAKTVRKNNTSGVPGVDWRAGKGVWRAAICFKGKRYYLGGYQRFGDAVAARKLAEANLHDSFLREFAEKQAAGMSPDPVSHAGAVGIDVQTGKNSLEKEVCL